MRTSAVIMLGLNLLSAARAADATETAAKSKIVAVDLFKNGLAVVKREVTLDKPGTYVLDDVPQPVHGTFWIESAGKVEAVLKTREVELPATDTQPGNPQEDFAGKKVTIHFKGAKLAPVSGTMAKLKPAKDDDTPAAPKRLVIQTAKGRAFVEESEIAMIETENADEKVKRQQPRLLLTLSDTAAAETKVTIRYLARGLSWAPSYKIDITDPKALCLQQDATIRNEMSNLNDAEVRLISGYPSVQFAHVQSLLAPHTTWASFFSQMSSSGGRDNDVLGNATAQFQTPYNSRGATMLVLGATPTGEGVDLHFQPIGKRTLADGEVLALTVAKGKADYERIVEWTVPDTRNEFGQYARASSDESDEAWDSLKFKNPLAFPMTTGPATVVSGGAFNGQRTSFWVNAGEETILRVNKALSVRTRATENEKLNNQGGRDLVWVGGQQYRNSNVEGELAVSNYRKESIQIVIRRRFSGELVDAEATPKSSLREEGVYSVNRRNELVWTLTLKAGEERKLKYHYTVLVHQ